MSHDARNDDEKEIASMTGAGELTGPSAFAALQTERLGERAIIARDCPLCGRNNDDRPPSRYSQEPWSVKDCSACSFVYIDRVPKPESLSEDAAWEKSSNVEDEWRARSRGVRHSLSKATRWRLHILPRKTMPALLERFANPGRVVDLGCGDGGQMHHLGSRFVPYGVEISKGLAGRASARFRQRGGDAVHAPSAEGLRQFPDSHFSAATLRSYLEHEHHPRAVLDELNRTLRDDGVAIVKVPNYGSWNRRIFDSSWCGFRHPDHLNYFTPETLREMAARSGFETRFPLGWALPTGDNMWALLTKAAHRPAMQ